MEDPPRKFFRLAPGREVRLRYAYFITCTEVIKDAEGKVVELRCSYDPATRGGDAPPRGHGKAPQPRGSGRDAPDGRKVKATLHWVSTADAVEAEIRLYDRLFKVENPLKAPADGTWLDNLNPDSLQVLNPCYLEPSLAATEPGFSCQFERLGYFCADLKDHTPEKPVFNRTVTLRDIWARLQKQQGKK